MAETVKQGSETTERTSRKTRVGMVVSDKMAKTVLVSIERRVQHPVYGKLVRRTKKPNAHGAQRGAKPRRATPSASWRPGPCQRTSGGAWSKSSNVHVNGDDQ